MWNSDASILIFLETEGKKAVSNIAELDSVSNYDLFWLPAIHTESYLQSPGKLEN